ncbi:hypothetical protein GF385_01325, partial [Candidatus Dependentiae bacterium]|nr:hypothetical protein [Candidatus Dependentiae bacterium]
MKKNLLIILLLSIFLHSNANSMVEKDLYIQINDEIKKKSGKVRRFKEVFWKSYNRKELKELCNLTKNAEKNATNKVSKKIVGSALNQFNNFLYKGKKTSFSNLTKIDDNIIRTNSSCFLKYVLQESA